MIISIIYFIASLLWTHHSQSWNLSNNPQGYSAALRSQNRSYKSVQTPLDQFPRPSLFNKLRHRQEGGDRVSAQGKLLQEIDHARIKPQLLTFPTCRSMTDQNASKCLPLQSIDRPIPLYQQQGSNRVGNDMSTRKIYFYVPLAPVEEFMERIGFPAHWWVPARGSLAPPIVPCLCWSPPGPTCPPSVLSSRHPESTPKPQSSTIALMFLHSAWHAGAEQRWGRMSQIGPIG